MATSSSSTGRWLFNAGVVGALAVLFGLHYTNRPLKLAYVDSNRLLHDYQAMTDARRTYNLHKQEWQRNLDTLQATATRALHAYQRTRATLSPARREEAEARLRLQRQQYLDYRDAIQHKDGEEQQQLTQQVLDSSNVFLKKYGSRHDYDLILLTAEGDNLAYAKEGFDVTVPVIKELNEVYAEQKSAPKQP